MSIKLDLFAEALLRRLARARKWTRASMIGTAVLLLGGQRAIKDGEPRTLYDMWKPMIGCVSLGGRLRARPFREVYREHLLRKKRQGRL